MIAPETESTCRVWLACAAPMILTSQWPDGDWFLTWSLIVHLEECQEPFRRFASSYICRFDPDRFILFHRR